jgi:LPXTG-motif cell wall-anchored protein
MRWTVPLAVVAVAGLLLTARPASASTIWDGDTARGSASAVFGIDNCDAPGSIGTTTDPAHGTVWRFTKPAGDNRCEAHGIKAGGGMYHFANNATYYLGWSFRLSSTVDDNAVFQWKSYGDHIQNFPLVLKMQGGKLTLLNRQPGGVDHLPWSKPLGAGTWNRVVLGIHTSDAVQGGWAELSFNGVQQTFTNGATRWPCRTWDSSNDPKWGVYGAEGTAVTNDVDELRIGTTLADVTGAAGAPPAAKPTPSASSSTKPLPSAASTSIGPDDGTGGGTGADDGAPPPAAAVTAARSTGSGWPNVAVVAGLVAAVAVGGLLLWRRRRAGRRVSRHAVP